jgi:DNA ligase (NAD+)
MRNEPHGGTDVTMSKNNTLSIEELAALVARYQESYYNGEGEVSDGAFDALWDELKARAPTHPLLLRVGADAGNFPKARHIMPMGSQEKASNPAEFLEWAKKHPYDEYLVEHKLDGASLELQYREGILSAAVTRGDGKVGDVITENARKMHGVLPRLERDGVLQPLSGAVRGEVLMSREVHRRLYSDKANCRNAANGLLKRKDGVGAEDLHVQVYDAWFPSIYVPMLKRWRPSGRSLPPVAPPSPTTSTASW